MIGKRIFNSETSDARYFGNVNSINLNGHEIYVARIYRRGFEDDGTVTTLIETHIKVTPGSAKVIVIRTLKQLDTAH